MTRRRLTVPRFIGPTLWSYDTRRMDVRTSAETIITQVLNYGDWRMVRWLLKTYPSATIRTVVAYPHRGVWFPPVLNLWTKVYKIRLPHWLWQMAIRDLHHAPHHPKALQRYMRWYARRRKPFTLHVAR